MVNIRILSYNPQCTHRYVIDLWWFLSSSIHESLHSIQQIMNCSHYLHFRAWECLLRCCFPEASWPVWHPCISLLCPILVFFQSFRSFKTVLRLQLLKMVDVNINILKRYSFVYCFLISLSVVLWIWIKQNYVLKWSCFKWRNLFCPVQRKLEILEI